MPAAFTPEAGYFINRRSVSWLIGASVVIHSSESAWVTQHGVGSGKGSLWPHHVMAGARMYPCVFSLSLCSYTDLIMSDMVNGLITFHRPNPFPKHYS